MSRHLMLKIFQSDGDTKIIGNVMAMVLIKVHEKKYKYRKHQVMSKNKKFLTFS